MNSLRYLPRCRPLRQIGVTLLLAGVLFGSPLRQWASADTVLLTVDGEDYAIDIAVSADGSRIFYGQQDSNKIHMLNNSLVEIQSFPGFTDPGAIVVDPTMTYVYVTAINGQYIKRLKISDGTIVSTATTSWNGRCLIPLPDFSSLISCEHTAVVKRSVSDLDAGLTTHIANSTFDTVIVSAAVSPDGTRIYAAESDGEIHILDSTTLAIISTWASMGSNPTIALNADGTKFATYDFWADEIKIRSSLTGAVTTTISAPGVTNTRFSPDGLYLHALVTGGVQSFLTSTFRPAENTTLTQDPTSFEFNSTGDTLYALNNRFGIVTKIAVAHTPPTTTPPPAPVVEETTTTTTSSTVPPLAATTASVSETPRPTRTVLPNTGPDNMTQVPFALLIAGVGMTLVTRGHLRSKR